MTGGINGQAGGLVGYNKAAVSNSSASGAVITTGGSGALDAAGGLIGWADSGSSVANSHASGSVTSGNYGSLGGLVGLSSGNVTGSYASGNITGGNTWSGGLVGESHGTVDGSHATGTVTTGTYSDAGGLVGNSFAAISNSNATGAVSSVNNTDVGGLVGLAQAPVTNSSATGTATSLNYSDTGGLAGYASSTSTISNSYATGAINVGTQSVAGGLVGYNGGSVARSYATGALTVGTSSWAGGLAGQARAAITQSFATGAVNATGATTYLGGFVGYAGAALTDSYATGAIHASDNTSSVGGFVGYLKSTGSIATSYSTGAVAASAATGGLVGQNVGTSNVVSSFWDTTTSGQTGSAGGTGLTSSQWLTQGPIAMSNPAWDIANKWVPGYPYPVLRAFPYVVATLSATGSRKYGGVDPSFLVPSAVDQNGNNALNLLSGTFAPVTVDTGTGVGTYNAGGRGQSVVNAQLTYSGSLTIDPATLTLTGLLANNKVYDGTTVATLSLGSLGLSGLVGADTLTLNDSSAIGAFADKNAANGKIVTVSGITISGPGSANYVLAPPQTAATITPAPLTATFLANGKVYDGTTTATAASVSGLTGIVGSDSVSLQSASYNFTDKNAGTGKTVANTGYALSGMDSGNYALTLVPGGTASIAPAPLTQIFTATNKVYDGTTLAAATLGSLNGIVSGDSVSVSGTGLYSFSDKNATSGKSVTGSGLGLTGPDAGNYTLAVAENGTATITPATLTETFTASGKVYDGKTGAAGALGTLQGLLAGDSVTLSGTAAYNFANKNAGANKPVLLSGLGLTGHDAGNYVLSTVENGSVAITPAPLLYTAAQAGASRPFGAANPVLNGTVTGFVGGDTLASTTTGAIQFRSLATPSSAIASYGILGSGLTMTTGNYTLAQSPANANAFTVNPITITIGNASRFAGAPNTPFTVSYSGPSSAYLEALFSSLVFVTNAPASDVAGSYQITALIPAALASSVLVQPGTLTITSDINNAMDSRSPQALSTLPASLQTQTLPPPGPLPGFGGSSEADPLLPANASGMFQVVITPSQNWNGTYSSVESNALSHASFTESSPDGRSKDNKSTYAAGAQ